ncbi:unnamed protein product [Euphydryas editha]|uniref:Uncharacterized protein n=1 Tax=Euphydryas editha TaxID=104508 RepID=A0AAU9U101_EUPED|nr:unnamed protein product [Euphydryas editha]
MRSATLASRPAVVSRLVAPAQVLRCAVITRDVREALRRHRRVLSPQPPPPPSVARGAHPRAPYSATLAPSRPAPLALAAPLMAEETSPRRWPVGILRRSGARAARHVLHVKYRSVPPSPSPAPPPSVLPVDIDDTVSCFCRCET